MLRHEMYVSYSTELLVQLCEIWPNPDTNEPGINPSELANLAGFKSRQTVHNYFEGRKPDDAAKMLLGRFFGCYFVIDYDGHLAAASAAFVAQKKTFFETYVYGKRSA